MKSLCQRIPTIFRFDRLINCCTKQLLAMASTIPTEIPKPMIGVCQVTCTADKEKNFQVCRSLVQRAKIKGAQVNLLEMKRKPSSWVQYLRNLHDDSEVIIR